MKPDLLCYSIERIASLFNFYVLEKDDIKEKATNGMKKNCFGFMTENYFSKLVAHDSDHKDSTEKLQKKLEKYIEVMESDSKEQTVKYRIKNTDKLKALGVELDISKATLNYTKYLDMPIIHGNNTLIMLITRFEEFVSNYFSELYALYPEKYLDNQTVTFSEINSSTIEDVKKFIIEREVDLTMRDSYKNWLKILKSHKILLQEYTSELETLEELYARRNIIVHNSGRVNSTYLSQVKNTNAEIGQILIVDNTYLENAFNAIEAIIFGIMIESVKLTTMDKKEYHTIIFNEAFKKLCDSQNYLCSKIFRSLETSKYLSSEYKIMSQINCWIARKETESLESIMKELKEFDTSALNESFEMAKNLLIEDYDTAVKHLENMYEKKEIDFNIIEYWPLFNRFRNSEYFLKFKERHIEDASIATFEVEKKNTSSSENPTPDCHCDTINSDPADSAREIQ